MPTLRQRFKAVEAAIDGPERYLDMRLDLTRPGGESVITSGGRWDKTFGRFCDPTTEQDAEQSTLVELVESQVDFALWFAEWLCAFREGYPRDVTLAMMASDRRAGKSFVAVAAVVACCVDAPVATDGTPLIAWIVAKNFRERFELEQWILNRIPSTDTHGKHGWYRHVGAPVHEFRFVHGPTLRLISADDDDSTKQGRVDIAFINEPQKMGPRAVANAVLGCSDLGGLCILAANPPGGNSRGEWMFDLKDAIDDEAFAIRKNEKREPLGIKYFHLDSKKNKAIDQIARRRAGRIATIIDPTLAAGDVEGEWRRPVEKACWEFDKHRHYGPAPQVGIRDITRTVVNERSGEYGDWAYVAGTDLQTKPHIVTVIYRVFGDIDDPMFCAVDEFTGERRWTEELYLEAFRERFPQYTPETLLFIMDASSDWQGTQHDFENGERDSFSVWRDDGWTVVQPQESKGRGKPGRGRNPNIDDRLQLFNELLRRDRWRVDEKRCPWTAECVRQATTKRETGRRRLVGNKYAHDIDAATYPLWRLARKPGSGSRGGPPLVTVPVARYGSDF